jgi:hypothetical protein
VTREDAQRESGVGDERSAASPLGLDDALALSADERAVLEVLVDCGTSRTEAQIAAKCGLPRENVAGGLEALRAKGLVSRFNTLVESYAARFPGVEV